MFAKVAAQPIERAVACDWQDLVGDRVVELADTVGWRAVEHFRSSTVATVLAPVALFAP